MRTIDKTATVSTTSFKEDFNNLFNELYPSLVFYAQEYIEDLEVSKDIVQNVFVRYWSRFSESNQKVNAKNYLYRSVYNASIDFIRHNIVEQKRMARYLYLNDTFEIMNDLVIEDEMRSCIEKAKKNLPKKCGKIFYMSRDEGLSYKEIAEKLELSVKTVETQVSKALRVFRDQLSEYMM